MATVLVVAITVLGFVLSSGTGSDDGSDGSDDSAPGPLPLVAVPAPEADSEECAGLVEAAPRELDSSGERLASRELAEPAPPATLAWGEDDPVVLRCGLERPPELTPSSPLRQIDEVQWLYVEGEGTATWYVVDRAVYIALTVPETAGTGPLQQISETVAKELPAVPLDFE